MARQSVNHLQQTSSLLYKLVECVCRFQTSVLLNHVCIFLTAECVCCIFRLFFIRRPGSSTNLIQCKDVGLLNGTPRFFFYMVVFLYEELKKRQEACSVHRSDVKKKKKSSSEKLVFHHPLTQRNLSFAIIVICSTFVNTMFLINVHRHECQYNCKRFNYGNKQGTSLGEIIENKRGEKGPDSIWEIIY